MIDPKDITINGKQLSKILESHKKWIMVNSMVNSGERANLQGAYLQGAYLQDANLQGAYLRDADLRDADLQDANLRDADLQGAYLQRADLQGAYLQDANLQGANLRDADLRDANLQGADLRDANLQGAKNAELSIALITIVANGDIVGWKKLADGLIAKLLIPSKAKRSNASGRKCRAEFAKVLEIWNGDEQVGEGRSDYNSKFIYRVGKTVKPDSFDDNRWDECSNGIHFFITRIEAENYN